MNANENNVQRTTNSTQNPKRTTNRAANGANFAKESVHEWRNK